MVPDSKNVVNIALISEEVIGILFDDRIFVDSKSQIGVGGGGGCTHGGPSLLVPECISKLEYIVAHDNGEGIDESIRWNGLELMVALVDILGYLDDSHASSDVGIHGGGIGGEQTSTGGEG